MKPDLNKLWGCISMLELQPSMGGKIRVDVDLHDHGQIDFFPWTSYQPGDCVAQADESVMLAPTSTNDMEILRFLLAHAERVYAERDKTPAEIADEEDSPDIGRFQDECKPLVIVDGEEAGKDLREWALR